MKTATPTRSLRLNDNLEVGCTILKYLTSTLRTEQNKTLILPSKEEIKES